MQVGLFVSEPCTHQEAHMFLDSSFALLLQDLAVGMTAPSFSNFMTILTGWVLLRGVSSPVFFGRWCCGQTSSCVVSSVFAGAHWSLDALGLAVFRMVEMLCGETIFLAIDDTLARKRGLKTFGVGMHHDPLLSSRGMAVTNWSHCWVVLSVIVFFPLWPERPFCIPILFRLYLNKKAAEKARRCCRTKPELAVDMLRILCRHRQNKRFHAMLTRRTRRKCPLATSINCGLTAVCVWMRACTMHRLCDGRVRTAVHVVGATSSQRRRRCLMRRRVASN
jgi:hypothetical protein